MKLTGPTLDILDWIDDPSNGRNGLYGPSLPLIPSFRTAKESFQDACDDTHGAFPLQVTPRTPSHVFMIAITLLSASVPSVDTRQRNLICNRYVATCESILLGVRRVWAALSGNGRFAGGISVACLGALVSCLRKVYLSLFKLASPTISYSRATTLLSEILSVALASERTASGSLVVSEIGLLLTELSTLAQESASVANCVSEHLLPPLCDVARSRDCSATFVQALQASPYNVSISMILITFSANYLIRFWFPGKPLRRYQACRIWRQKGARYHAP